jgi:hypothetical protein
VVYSQAAAGDEAYIASGKPGRLKKASGSRL